MGGELLVSLQHDLERIYSKLEENHPAGVAWIRNNVNEAVAKGVDIQLIMTDLKRASGSSFVEASEIVQMLRKLSIAHNEKESKSPVSAAPVVARGNSASYGKATLSRRSRVLISTRKPVGVAKRVADIFEEAREEVRRISKTG